MAERKMMMETDEMLKAEEMVKAQQMMVLCQDVLGYMNEHNVSLNQAYDEIGVPEDMRVDIDVMQDFLYPDDLGSKY